MKACLFHGNRIVVLEEAASLPQAGRGREWADSEASWFEVSANGRAAVAAEVPEDWTPPPEGSLVTVRQALAILDDDEARLALTAVHVGRWRRTSKYCGACGAPTREGRDGRAFECPSCGHLMFPKVSPSVIVQVSHGDRILLGRSRRHPSGLYSVLAGFVDPGESLEEAVHREIREESGVSVGNVRYFGSQPWPFPDSLMVGFTAEYEGGEIRNEDDEMEDVRWFSAHDLPPVPPPYSIARALIDDFARRHGVDPDSIPTWNRPRG